MRTLKLTRGNKTYTVSVIPTYYRDNLSLAIELSCKIGNVWEPYGSLTTNLGENPGLNNAYVDTNNMGTATLATHKNQVDALGEEKYLYMQREKFRKDMSVKKDEGCPWK